MFPVYVIGWFVGFLTSISDGIGCMKKSSQRMECYIGNACGYDNLLCYHT